jgi:hypothetical protein
VTEKREIERRVTLGISLVLLVLALPLLVLSGFSAVAVIGGLPDNREGFVTLSIVLTFALFFSAMAWRGFASVGCIGPALTVRGWRLLAGALVVVAAIGAVGHLAGLALPLIVALLCLCNDPAVGRILEWIGMSL